MIDLGKIEFNLPSENEISWTRVFDAPREMVFDALTKPALIRKWLLGPDGWSMIVCEVDLRVGGAYRYVWKHAQKGEMGMGGFFREISRPERIVNTEKFDAAWYEGEAIGTVSLSEKNGKTTLLTTIRYVSRETRDQVLKSNMEAGLRVSYNHLAGLLAQA